MSYPLYDTDEFAKWAQAHDLHLVDEMAQAIWLTIDGKLYGSDLAVEPHELQSQVASYLESWPAYNAVPVTKTNFWSVVHEATGLIRVVSDTEIVRTMIGQFFTPEQNHWLETSQYEIEPYTKNRHYFE
ncbi:hypothetical protein EQG49_01695 [Periweissella cryptocerci]|uniref:Uncharacterized protein n=1 Tax=Periweissella cryptocerci TaxID=2506420 RepID=A0A4P6YRN9_9LACO|nr:hypothetical protein [Periweissella cryptocerci]QBO35263.1 hypothetical protein EQG49_01695 [Periweissella cryptocerci]